MDVYQYDNSLAYAGLPNHLIEERQDVIFRKVRGILNKITPETFDKLSKELVNVGLDSPRTLRGVIYILFDKALKDLKYSSLYAKLCQELSEKSPNFEKEPGPNTFCKFLISKCEDEFESRRKATEDFDSKKTLTDEEYEHKAIVKQKMLGNIKFICELGKKRLLREEILHECIRGLLSKKKERPIQDQAQDLECLCQIMRTIGSLMDSKASKNLMNQYFERIDMFSKKPELPSRIRFMLRDVIDLRNNNWRLRPFQREDNVPQPLSKLRDEAGFDASLNQSVDRYGNSRSTIGISDLVKMNGGKLSMLMDDEPSFTTTTDFHWGPSFMNAVDSNPFDAFSSSRNSIGSKPQPQKHSAPITSMNLTTLSRPKNLQITEPHLLQPPQPVVPPQVGPHQSRQHSSMHIGGFQRIEPPRRFFGPNHFGHQVDMNSRNVEDANHHNQDRGFRNQLIRNQGPDNFSFSNESDRVLDWRSGPSNPQPHSPNVLNVNSSRKQIPFPTRTSFSSRPPMKPCDANFVQARQPPRRRNFDPRPQSQLQLHQHQQPHQYQNQHHQQQPYQQLHSQQQLRPQSPISPPQTAPFQFSPPTTSYIPPRQPSRRRIIEIKPEPITTDPIAPVIMDKPPSPVQIPVRRITTQSRPPIQRQLDLSPTSTNHQYNKNLNNINTDIFDRKEQSKKFFTPNHPLNLTESNSKNFDNPPFHQERVPRNANGGRNQYNFDSSLPNEADKISNWRKGVININHNTNNNTKESVTIPIQAPILPKPPSRTETNNFSLRPSHNLVGRIAVPSMQNLNNKSKSDSPRDGVQSSRNGSDQNLDNTKLAKEVSGNSIITDINKEKENCMKSVVTENNGNDSQYQKKFMSILSEMSNELKPNMSRLTNKIKELKISKSAQSECLTQAIKESILKIKSDRDNMGKLIAHIVPSIFDTTSLLDAFKSIFDQMRGLEAEIPKVKSLVAEMLSQTILDGLLSLEEVGSILSGGKHHPLFLLVLQKLEKTAGKQWLHEKFIASKINLIDMLPEVDRSRDRSASILKDRCLGFLDPMLTIEPDLWDQMNQCDFLPGIVYRWIKDNVDPGTQATPTFAHVLISCVLKYIHNAVSEKTKSSNRLIIEPTNDGDSSESNKSSPTLSSQSSSDIEKELLTKYQPVLQAILEDKQMQLATLYAVQTFYHGLDFPKGALLRWFHMLYDMNIVDDNVFITWKEEINDEYPGKGQALFQVNAWLNWLAETESEEEEDV